ncbi:MAG: hypothetical protein JWR32_128 [Mycobacterium sp.]|jgi:hypothetical protein|nr:hypothetical protein [Mycobacterium sp.]
MTAAIAVDGQRPDRAEQLQALRHRIAAVSGKMSRGHSAPHPTDELLPESQSLLPIPESLAELLPVGLPRGSVVVASGARSLPLAVTAGVTAAGGHAAVVGHPDIGLLAAVEMGADLTRVALVPDPGSDPVEVAAVLMDGMDLVVLGLGGRSVPMSRARAVMARARSKGCTLLVTDGNWQGAAMRLEARVSGYEVTAPVGAPVAGHGRISRVRLAVRSCGRGVPLRASG